MLATEWLAEESSPGSALPTCSWTAEPEGQPGRAAGVSWDRVGIAQIGKESGEGWLCHSALRSQQNRHLRFSFGSFPRDALGKVCLTGGGEMRGGEEAPSVLDATVSGA